MREKPDGINSEEYSGVGRWRAQRLKHMDVQPTFSQHQKQSLEHVDRRSAAARRAVTASTDQAVFPHFSPVFNSWTTPAYSTLSGGYFMMLIAVRLYFAME
ncbi:hypothetical protein AJ79_03981 [Helicocarpus griseus UAMH5409]|uniref:Uncharacterized protein n=1 Tax=Helicocarpus griseus UAMH5409 TaxID=1447875 RepID=A0A2B7XVU3_9EURO|nr:hypothetical protein AJ79_03981 [Helicocarpus griseus UAMH5409]